MVKNPLAAGFKGGVVNYLRSWKKLLSSLRGWHEHQISSGYFGCREKGLGRSRGEGLLDQQAKPGMSVQGRINESRVAPITLHVGPKGIKRNNRRILLQTCFILQERGTMTPKIIQKS